MNAEGAETQRTLRKKIQEKFFYPNPGPERDLVDIGGNAASGKITFSTVLLF
jgi:hypothetical protein